MLCLALLPIAFAAEEAEAASETTSAEEVDPTQYPFRDLKELEIETTFKPEECTIRAKKGDLVSVHYVRHSLDGGCVVGKEGWWC